VGSTVAIKSLTLFNFRSFRGLHQLTFPSKGLVILRGSNQDTNGDSGAGKTNILLAIAYAFGYCRHSAKALQCWYDEEPMYVEVELETPEGVVTVRRGVKGISIGALKGKSAEAKLDAICGVPTELREILTYRDQVRPRKFLDMRDTGLKKFLTQVLQLHGLEAEIEAAEKLLGELEKKKDNAGIYLFNVGQDLVRRQEEMKGFSHESTAELEEEFVEASERVISMEGTLEAYGIELKRIKQLELEHAATLGLEAAQREADYVAQANALKDQPSPEQKSDVMDDLQAKAYQAEAFISSLSAADKVAQAAYEAETKALRLRARQLHNELALVPGLVDDSSRLTAEIDKLKADLCDRCGRQWDNAKIALDRHHRLLDEKLAALDTARGHKHEAAKLDAELATRVFVPDFRIERLVTVATTLADQIKAEHNRLNTEAAVLRSERRANVDILMSLAAREAHEARRAQTAYLHDPQLPSRALEASQEALKGVLAKTLVQVAEVKGKLALVRQANAAGVARYAEQKRAADEASTRKDEAETAYADAETAWKAQSDYADLLKGFRNRIFDEVLGAISADATSIIGTLPNSQHISIDFRSERETAKGTIQERITPVTYLYGEERDLEEAVSGGQLTSISLAVDLAVAGVISSRLGCNLNWVVLDEAFEGHDTITKLACLEMLQTYAADKLVIIVDHASEFKEMFSKEIQVIFKDKHSTIDQKDLS
jgi:ABC-type lipoprotein export system ATPase subunit